MFSTMDINVGIIVQTDKLVAPTTGNLMMLDYIPGSMMTKETTVIDSNTLKPKRSSAGSRRGRQEVKGSFKFRLHRDKAMDTMLSSVLSNTWTEAGATGEDGDTLISGTKDVYMMIVQEYINDSGATIRDHYLGCVVTKISFSCENNAGIEVTADFIGLKSEDDLAGASTLTRVAASNELELIGDDVMNVAVGGVTVTDYTKLDVSIEQAREGKFVLGKSYAVKASASAPRKVMGELTYFREGAQAGFTGAGQTLSFDLLDAYRFEFPSIYCSFPQSQYGSSDIESKVSYTAGYNNTAATDVKITRP